MKTEKATFAAGCFWEVEAAFRKIPGVVSTRVGYAGGTVKNPTYKLVCSNNTGHAEAVEITFDPKKVSYEQLLDVFWQNHDPTQGNRQGLDVGAQYRSAIFYHSEKQKATAATSKKQQQKNYGKPITTEIKKAPEFYEAEDYHQQYLEKGGLFGRIKNSLTS